MKLFYPLFIGLCMTHLHAADTEQKFDLSQVSVEPLKHYPEHIDDLTKMWHDVLGYKRFPDFEATKSKYKAMLEGQMNDDKLPLALVALFDGKPIGLCALRDVCIPRKGACVWSDEHPDKKPWFAIFVAATYQQQGVGTKLIKETVKRAQNTFGFDKAYVMPEDDDIQALYARKGCVKIADTTRDGQPAVIMEIAFAKILKD